MCLICCNVRIRTKWPSGCGVHGWPSLHRRKCELEHTGRRFRGETDDVGHGTGGAEAGSRVHRMGERCAEGVQSPSSDNRVTVADHPTTGPTVPTARVRPHQDGEHYQETGDWSRRTQDTTSSRWNWWTTLGQSAGNFAGHTAIWRGSQRFDDTDSEYSYIGSAGSSRGPSDCIRQSQEISGLPGLYRVGLNSVERLNCSTPDSQMTQARRLSRWTVEDAVLIQPPTRYSLGPDLATHPGGRSDMAGTLTSICSPPGPALENTERVATAELKMRQIKQMNPEFSQYYAGFHIIAADLDWNRPALQNAWLMEFFEEMKDSFTYRDIPEELPAFVTVSQKRDNQIQQRHAEKVAQTEGGGTGFASSPSPLAPLRIPQELPLGQWQDILDQRIWISVHAEGGFLRNRGQKDLQMGGVCTVVGLTTGRHNVQQGRRLRSSRQLERGTRM